MHPPVAFVPGTDIKAFHTTPENPAGFKDTGLTPAQIEGLMELIQGEYERILGTAPEGLGELAGVPSTVNVYSLVHYPIAKANPNIFKACLSQDLCTPRVTRKPNGRVSASMPCEHNLIGLGIQCSPDDLTDQKRKEALQFVIGHELTHLITRKGISTLMRSRLEALTDPILQQIYGKSCGGDSLADIEEFGWDAQSLQSTTGFAEPDCAMVPYYPPAIMALYLATPLALRGIAIESIWKIWKILMEEVHSTGFFPLANDIRSAILNVLQERGERVLANPCFLPFREGPNVCAISATDRSCSLAIPLVINRLPSFGIDAQGHFQNTYAEVHPYANRIPYSHRLHDHEGKVLQRVRINGNLGDVETWSYGTWMAKMQSSPQFPILKQMMGSTMTFEIPELRPIHIVRSENDPYGRVEAWNQSAAGWVARGT